MSPPSPAPRLVLDDEVTGGSAHHMTAVWGVGGQLAFDDAAAGVHVRLGIAMRKDGRDDYGTITEEGDGAALFVVDDLLVVQLSRATCVHTDLSRTPTGYLISDDGGRSWRRDDDFAPRLAGRTPSSVAGL